MPEASQRQGKWQEKGLRASTLPPRVQAWVVHCPLTVRDYTASPSSLSPDEIGVVLPFDLLPAALKVTCLPSRVSVDLWASLGLTEGLRLVAPFLCQAVSSGAHMHLGAMSVSRGGGNAEERHPSPWWGCQD